MGGRRCLIEEFSRMSVTFLLLLSVVKHALLISLFSALYLLLEMVFA